MPKLTIEGSVYNFPVFKEINSDGSFLITVNYQHDLLYSLLHPELFLYRNVSVTLWTVLLTLIGSQYQTHMLLIRKYSLTKIYFFVHIIHSSVNLTRFSFFSSQKFDYRPLFQLVEICFCCHFK